MTNKEAIAIVRGVRNSFQEDCINEYESLDLAIKAINLLSTVTDGCFHDLREPMVDYKKGWNDALEAVKIKWEADNEQVN